MRKSICICDVCKKETDPTEVVRLYIAYRARPIPSQETFIDDVCPACEASLRIAFDMVIESHKNV